MRDEIDRLKNKNENAATLEKINRLQEAIKQVDEARQEDNKKVLAEMARLRGLLEKAASKIAAAATVPPPAVERPDPPAERVNPKPPANHPPENGYEYTIKKGDTLSGITTALRSQGYKVSQKQMEDANPGVNWGKLRVGQKVFIPPPSP
jgi:LysM repeat protein